MVVLLPQLAGVKHPINRIEEVKKLVVSTFYKNGLLRCVW